MKTVSVGGFYTSFIYLFIILVTFLKHNDLFLQTNDETQEYFYSFIKNLAVNHLKSNKIQYITKCISQNTF